MVELEDMGREIGEVEGNPDAGPSSGSQEAERDYGQSMGLAGGRPVAGGAGRKPSGKSVSFAPDLPTQEAEDIQ